jgi:signal peptidase I
MLVLRIASAFDAYRCIGAHEPPYRFALAIVPFVIAALGVASMRATIDSYVIPTSSMTPTLLVGDHIHVDKLSIRWRAPARGEIVVFEHPCSKRVFVKRVLARGGDTVEVRCSIVHVNGRPLPAHRIADGSYRDRDDRGAVINHEGATWGEQASERSYETFRDRDPAANARGDFPQLDRPFPPGCTASDFYERAPGNAQPSGQLVRSGSVGAGSCEQQLHLVVPPGALFMMGDNRGNANDSRHWGLVAEQRILGRVIGIWRSEGPDGIWGRFGDVD